MNIMNVYPHAHVRLFVILKKNNMNVYLNVFVYLQAASNMYSYNLTHCDFEDGVHMCNFTQNTDDQYNWLLDNALPDHTLGSKLGEPIY